MKHGLRISIFILTLANCSNTNAQTGTMIDTRDRKEYSTVQIGNQVWMAQNLAYIKNNNNDPKAIKEGLKGREFQFTTCYQKYRGNCDKFGMLYSWKTAQDVCPMGWHLPSKEEFDTLISLGNKKDPYLNLISKWGEQGLFGGRLYVFDKTIVDGRYLGLNKVGLFWTSTRAKNDYVIILSVNKKMERVEMNDSGKNNGLSVRCLKDK